MDVVNSPYTNMYKCYQPDDMTGITQIITGITQGSSPEHWCLMFLLGTQSARYLVPRWLTLAICIPALKTKNRCLPLVICWHKLSEQTYRVTQGLRHTKAFLSGRIFWELKSSYPRSCPIACSGERPLMGMCKICATQACWANFFLQRMSICIFYFLKQFV